MMQAVEEHPYVEQVVASLAGDAPHGEALGEDPTLEFLENEIMKIGSLAHTGIDWTKVEQESLRLLSDLSKDLKVLGFLLLALQRGGNGERFALSVHLLCEVMESWWSDAWPYPGDKGARPRRLMFGQMMQRAAAEVDKITFDSAVGDGRSFCLARLDKLAELAEAQSIPTDGVLDLKRTIKNMPEVGQSGSAVEPKPPTSQPSTQRAPVPETTAAPATASLGNLSLDPNNERATRQSLLKVADLLTDLSPAAPLGYQLRRYAIWQAITTAPPARDGIRSDLAAVSADRVSEYQDSLARGGDDTLWGRIEQSLAVSPFWLEGHYLSAQAAEAAGQPKCAEAIRVALKEFVERLPALADMTFSDGTPFLPKAVGEWLLTSGAGVDNASGSDWEAAYETAQDVLEQKGLAPAMQLLEDGLADAREPRSQFYWRLMSADLLRDSGLKTLARQQVADLRAQTQDMKLEDWEPSLMAHLERLG